MNNISGDDNNENEIMSELESEVETIQVVESGPEEIIGADEEKQRAANENIDNSEENLPFKEGQPITFINVRFPGNARSFQFFIGKKRYSYGQQVLAMSDRGMAVGYVNSFPYDMEFKKELLPLKRISKIASQEDLEAQFTQNDKERESELICLKLIKKHSLDMQLTHVEIIQFGKKAVFYFIAPDRVDFRELVKDLVAELKIRIELRQISIRDRTAALGAIGACGRQNCCSQFLKKIGTVNIKMAKNQNIALIPSKINGVCGQLKCCLKYEDHLYTSKRKNLPEEGKFIVTKCGDIGKVIKIHLLKEEFEMITDSGKHRRYYVSEYLSNQRPPQDWKYPTSFENIINETKELVGAPVKNQTPCCQKDQDCDGHGCSREDFQESNNQNNSNNNSNNNNNNNNNSSDEATTHSSNQKLDRNNNRDRHRHRDFRKETKKDNHQNESRDNNRDHQKNSNNSNNGRDGNNNNNSKNNNIANKGHRHHNNNNNNRFKSNYNGGNRHGNANNNKHNEQQKLTGKKD